MKRIVFEALTVHAIYNEFSTFNIYHMRFHKVRLFDLNRYCIGMNFGMAEMKIAVAMILRR